MATTYAEAGVDIAAGEDFAGRIKWIVDQAWPGTAGEIGRFAGGGQLPEGAKAVTASIDGTGTKAILAGITGKVDGIGQDAVAMAAVDTYVAGSRPAYALDVLDVDHLESERDIRIIASLVRGCLKAGCKLVGGETAELPGMFKHPWMFNLNVSVIGFPAPELAFCSVEPGQKVYGWPFGGIASNGFSLARKVLQLTGNSRDIRRRLEQPSSQLGTTLAKELLRPTPIWIPEMEHQRKRGIRFAGHAHITGDGMPDNIPRILPEDCRVVIDRGRWLRPPIFRLIQERGEIPLEEMDRAFNNGVMVVSIVARDGPEPADPNVVMIGWVRRRRSKRQPQVELVGEYNDGLL